MSDPRTIGGAAWTDSHCHIHDEHDWIGFANHAAFTSQAMYIGFETVHGTVKQSFHAAVHAFFPERE